MNRPINYDDIVTVRDNGLTPLSETASLISSATKDRISHVLIPEECIEKRVRALAGQVSEDQVGSRELNFVVVLKGAFVFASDLGREIARGGGPEVKYHFIKSSAYHRQIKQPGEARREVRIELAPGGLENKDVLLIDDILDQGFTLSTAKRHLIEQGVSSLRICTLLNKRLKEPSEEARRSRNALTLDHVGFEIPDKWVAGYGIDAGEDFRHLPFIVVVNEDYYLGRS